LWVHDAALAAAMQARRVNPTYLSDFDLPPSLRVTPSMEEACRGAAWVLLAVPSHHCREVLTRSRDHLAGRPVVIVASKGIETATLLRVSQVAVEVLEAARHAGVAVLSGPSFAREVASGRPTAVVAASSDPALAASAQALLSRSNLRVYTSGDPVGVELGGALKNVIAIAAGVVEGLGLGANTLAALITRGLAEMSRLAVALGARRETLSGLSGLGDLVLTCTGSLSRNRYVGLELGRGRRLEEILAGRKMIAEGVRTARAAVDLGRREGIEIPITEKIQEVLTGAKAPEAAIQDLLGRPPRPEQD